MKPIPANCKDYIQVMEQVGYPDGVLNHHPVNCTPEQAAHKIGRLYPDNPAWRTIEMKDCRSEVAVNEKYR